MDTNDLLRQHSQELRKNMTKEERHLWYDFLKTYPVQFKRQYTIGNYIADFYCFRAKLVVELDGSQHCDPEAIAYDQRRTAYMQQQVYHVLRLSNRDVMTQFTAVCAEIHTAVQSRIEANECPHPSSKPVPKNRF